jgi:hypothetical protein
MLLLSSLSLSLSPLALLSALCFLHALGSELGNRVSHCHALQEPLAVRREKLQATFEIKEGSLQFATSKDASDTEEILAFLNESVKDSCEVRARALV